LSGSTEFRTFVEGTSTPLPDRLPLIHVTQATWAMRILGDGQIVTRWCPIFAEDLIYCFYGCARYRSNSSKPTRPTAWLPMAFILQCDEYQHHIKRVFPFDSGAFSAGLFAAAVHVGMAIEEFQLAPTIESAQRCVKAFFESNPHYINEHPSKVLTYPAANLHVNSYAELIAAPATADVDHRRSAIEIQLDSNIKISTSRFIALVVPEVLLDDTDFVQRIRTECGVDPTPYSVFGAAMDVTYGAMQHVVKTIIKGL
jgi:hypothetical protein